MPIYTATTGSAFVTLNAASEVIFGTFTFTASQVGAPGNVITVEGSFSGDY